MRLFRKTLSLFIYTLFTFLYLSGCEIQTSSHNSEKVISLKADHIGQISSSNKANFDFKSIDLKGNDFSDLMFLKDILADKRIVMLGESSHGVAEYNQMKGRLIKFLHEELDYNVVAFESGMTEVNLTNELLLELDSITGMKKSLYNIWHTNNNTYLFKYIREQKSTSQPINLVGFDMNSMGTREGLLYDFFEDINLEYAKAIEIAEKEFYSLTQLGNPIPDERNKKLIDQYKNLLSSLNEENSNLARSLNENIQQLFDKIFKQRLYLLTNIYNSSEEINYMNLRDKIMSENLVWLLNELYPDEKFVVWGHNGHIMKNNSATSNGWYVSMVEYLPESIKNEAYVIGLYMYSGKHKSLDIKEIVDVNTNHKTNSIEHRLNQSGYPVTFLNINIKDDKANSYWWNSEAIGKHDGRSDILFIPSEQYDGLILIDKVSPPSYTLQ
ncbi:erythromycin esterase family protein [Bacillus sp. SM2101]|uniref:erythromycin esterase family protein n=1 Tax=Bacillus sp. SM2101 TaxID=2805366 RepID=UPI001BDF2BD8|nr:erythromycin esterase family protein [Bacillus sp. SM2101]